MMNIPFIPSIIIALLLIVGGLITLIGTLGLLRFNDFTGRIHATTLGNTLGTVLVLFASGVLSWYIRDRVFFHEVVIIIFIFVTSPISAMLLMRSYTLRQERMNSH